MSRAKMSRIVFVACGALIFIAALVDFAGVAARFMTLPNIDFGPRLSVWLVIWAAFIATAPLAAEVGGHVAIKTLPNILNRRVAALLDKVSTLLTLAVSLVFAYAGALMTMSLWRRGASYQLMIEFPQYLVKLCVFVGMALTAVYCVIALIKGQSAPREGPPADSVERTE